MLILSTLKVEYPIFYDLSTKYYHFQGKQTLHLSLQNLNWFVNYNYYHVDEKSHWKWEGIYFDTLNISVANMCRFLVCIVTDLSCSDSFSKDDDMSPYNRRTPHVGD